MNAQDQQTLPTTQGGITIEVVNAEWQAMARCKAQPDCTNVYGVTWRFRISQAERFTKCRGRCLCEEHGSREVTPECDLVLGE